MDAKLERLQRTSLVVQWSGILPFNVGGAGSIPGQKAEISTSLMAPKPKHSQQKQYSNKLKASVCNEGDPH